jgi:integrase
MPKYRRGSGSVYKKRGWYYVKFYIDGEPKQEATRTKDRGEARLFLNKRLGELATGRYVGPEAERITFDELAVLVIRDYQANGKKTLAWAERRFKLHLKPFFGGKKVRDISSAEVQAFIVQRQQADASNGEINRELGLLKRAFNLGLRAELIVRKPYVPHLEENNVRQGFFEREDFDRVLAKLPDYLRPALTFGYATGWRILSEVLPLTWDRVDLLEGAVRLDPGTTKNKEGRLVYLPPELRAVLETQWQEHLNAYPNCLLVFHRNGERILSFYKAWDKACGLAGVSGKVPHDFRRSAVRNMVRAGIQERVAMEISGHRTRAIFDRYNIVSDGDLREAARWLGVAMGARTATISATQGTEAEEHPKIIQ